MHRSDNLKHLDLRAGPELEAMGFERVMTHALRDVITELFFINAGSLIAFINADKDANIEDLVASSAECSLQPGTLRYGGHASTQSDWGRPPNVDIHLEFHHGDLSVYFQLMFDATAVGLTISSIFFPEVIATFEERLSRLETALTEARRLDS